MSVICPYCQSPARLADSAEIYGRSYGPIYLCKPCDAYGWLCHKMKLAPRYAHIAMFDLAQCEELIRLLAKEGL